MNVCNENFSTRFVFQPNALDDERIGNEKAQECSKSREPLSTINPYNDLSYIKSVVSTKLFDQLQLEKDLWSLNESQQDSMCKKEPSDEGDDIIDVLHNPRENQQRPMIKDEEKTALDVSEMYANDIVYKLRIRLDYMRSKVNVHPINELIAERTMAQIKQSCLRFMRSEQTIVQPNAKTLVRVKDREMNRNKQIVMGFNLALGLPRRTTSDQPTFLDCFSGTDESFLKLSYLLQTLQMFANQTFKTYRLVVFSEDNDRIPVWIGKRIDSHERALGVYLSSDGDVFGIKNVERLFGTQNDIFCPDCYSCLPRSRPYEHRRKCPLRCPSCCMYGYEFPCDSGFIEKYCDECNRVFDNARCFENHKLITCEQVKCCPNCAETYIRTGKKKTDLHKCNVKRCGWCQKNHARREKCLY